MGNQNIKSYKRKFCVYGRKNEKRHRRDHFHDLGQNPKNGPMGDHFWVFDENQKLVPPGTTFTIWVKIPKTVPWGTIFGFLMKSQNWSLKGPPRKKSGPCRDHSSM